MLQNNLKKTVEPKIYALLLESMESIFLSIQNAYSLEEAFILAKLEFEKQSPTKKGIANPFNGAKIGLFAIKKLDELTYIKPEDIIQQTRKEKNKIEIFNSLIKDEENLKKQNIGLQDSKPLLKPLIDKKIDKNLLMQKIINTKDLKELKINKMLFSKEEQTYIKARIKEQTKK